MANTERQTTFVVKTKHQQAVSGMQAVGGSLQSLGLRATETQKKLKQITAFNKLSVETKEAGRSWKEAADHANRLAAELKKTEEPSKAQVREFEKAQVVSKKLYTNYKKQFTALTGLRKQLNASGISTRNLSAEQAKLSARFESARKSAVAATKIDLARGLLDIKKPQEATREVARLEAAYKRLQVAAKSGVVSDKELASAKRNLKTKIAELTGETKKYTATNKLSLAQLGKFGSYAGVFYAAVRGAKMMVSATMEAETSTYMLESAVAAANRQFSVGSVDDWRGRIARLGEQLKVYSTTELETATAKTIEMTKRLGLTTEQMEEVIRVSADLSAGKTDLAGGIERVTAALRGEAESAEYLGLTLNEDYVKAQYAAANANEKAWKSLTDLEKAQIRYQVLLDQATGTEGRAAGSINTLSGAWKYMQAQMTDAIRDNRDLQTAIKDAADAIAEHADDVLAIVTRLAQWTGKIVQFGVEYGAFAVGLLGSLATLKAVSGGVNGITAAIKLMGGVKIPEIIGSGGNINTVLAARLGLYGALAATVWKTYNAYQGMRDAQDEAAKAARRLAESEAYLQGVVAYAGETTGLQIKNIRELNQLLRDGIIVRSQLTGEHQTLAQAEEEHAERTARQLELDKERQASFERMIEHHRQVAEQYGELDIAAINAADKQTILDKAMADTEETAANLRTEMMKTADAYYDAAVALEHMAESEAGYEDAQKNMLKARKDYVDAARRLNNKLWQDAEKGYGYEEQALENSLERRKIQLEKQLQLGVISRREYNYQVTRAEEELQIKILQIRENALEASKDLLDQESEEYKELVQDKIDAELELQRTRIDVQKTLNKLDKDRGGSGGRDSSRDRRETGGGSSESQQQPGKYDEDQSQGGDQKKNKFSGTVLTGDNGAALLGDKSLDELTTGFNDSWSKLTGYHGAFAGELRGTFYKAAEGWKAAATKSVTSALSGASNMDELRNRVNQQLSQLKLDNGTVSGVISARDISRIAAEVAAASGFSALSNKVPEKQITLRFQAPNGNNVSGSFNESDAGKLMDILQQSGMTTA